MSNPGPSGKTDFTGIVNATQMLAQIVGQGTRAFVPVIADRSLVPTPSPSIALDMIRINSSGTAYETRTPTQIISDLGLNNTAPLGTSGSTGGTSLSVTTSLFTAPSTGALLIMGVGFAASLGSAGITTTLAGLVTIFTDLNATTGDAAAFGYLPMSTTQNTTATFTVTGGGGVRASIAVFFLPQA